MVDKFYVCTRYLWCQIVWWFFSTIKSLAYIYLDMCNLTVLIFEEVRRSHEKETRIMPYIPYTVDTSLSHPPNWGLWLKFWDKIFQKLCLCETSACLILPPPHHAGSRFSGYQWQVHCKILKLIKVYSLSLNIKGKYSDKW